MPHLSRTSPYGPPTAQRSPFCSRPLRGLPPPSRPRLRPWPRACWAAASRQRPPFRAWWPSCRRCWPATSPCRYAAQQLRACREEMSAAASAPYLPAKTADLECSTNQVSCTSGSVTSAVCLPSRPCTAAAVQVQRQGRRHAWLLRQGVWADIGMAGHQQRTG